jgi:hypothetical protein
MKVEKHILNQYFDLVREREEVKQRIENLEEQLRKMEEEGVVVDKVTGGEGGMQSYRIEGFPYPAYERKRLLLMMRKHNFESLEIQIAESLKAVEEFIASIDDGYVRNIVIHRVVDRLSWAEIADLVARGGSPDSVRKIYERFLAKN